MDYFSQIPEFEKLTLKRQEFLRFLFLDPQRIGSDAIRKAGFKTNNPTVRSSQLLKDDRIKLVIRKYNELISSDNDDLRLTIVKELSLIAFSNVKDFMSWSESNLKIKGSDTISNKASAVISEVSEVLSDYGSTRKIKLHDKMSALKELNKMHGFYAAEKVDLTNSDGTMKPTITITLPSNSREKKER